MVISPLAAAALAFAIAWTSAVPDVPLLKVAGFLFIAYFGCLLAGRLVLRRAVFRRGTTEVNGSTVTGISNVLKRRRSARYRPGMRVVVDYTRPGVANVFFGNPTTLLRLWAGTATPYLYQGSEREVVVCLNIGEVQQLLDAVGAMPDDVKTVSWFGAGRWP